MAVDLPPSWNKSRRRAARARPPASSPRPRASVQPEVLRNTGPAPGSSRVSRGLNGGCGRCPAAHALHIAERRASKRPMHKAQVLKGIAVLERTTGLVCALLLLAPGAAHASLLSPETEDKLATGLALFVIFLVPVVLIVLFWMVHILPEKIAHARHHPQLDAIRTLCLLSLVFGGLLWPIAWIWAYTKPVFHKLAYDTDVHPEASGYNGDEPTKNA